MDEKLLDIICCPASHQPLKKANAAALAAINQRIAKGEIANAKGEAMTAPLRAALVTLDGKVAYPVDDAIPVLLIEAAIPLS